MAEEEYNWLDDPFDEKKNTQTAPAGMSGASKLAVGLGCLGVIIVFIVIMIVATSSILSIATDMTY